MENIKKYWNDNLSDKAKIIIVSFFTFFTFICASMTNSFVSALNIKYPNSNKVYTYEHFVTFEDVNSDGIKFISTFYYDGVSNGLSKASDNKYAFLTLNGKVIKSNVLFMQYCYYPTSNAPTLNQYSDSTDDGCGNTHVHYSYFFSNISKFQKITTNDTSFYAYLKTNPFDYDFELKKVQSPLLEASTVEGIVPAITKAMKVIIPVGLVIFGAILGIYLIKRLVALFL